MLVEGVENGLEVCDFNRTAVSILHKTQNYAFVDEFKENCIFDDSEFSVWEEGDASGDSAIFFTECMSVKLLNHVDKFFAVVHFDKAEQVAQETNDRV